MNAMAAKNAAAPWALVGALVVTLALAGYAWVGWGELRVRAALGEEQGRMFEECRAKALETTNTGQIVGLIEAAIAYYPSGTKQRRASHLDLLVEQSRRLSVQAMLAHLRDVSGTNLGDDPQRWIDAFRRPPARPSGEADGEPRRSETNQTTSAADPEESYTYPQVLLELTDEEAPAWLKERARLFHSMTRRGERYRALQFSRVLAHGGGYAVRFGTSAASGSHITYYFNAKGLHKSTSVVAGDCW